MKNLFLLCFFILPYILTAQNDASKEETVNWLKSRLDYIAQPGEKNYHELKLVKYDYTNDTLFYKVNNMTGGKSSNIYRIMAIPIKDINPDRIRIVRISNYTNEMTYTILLHRTTIRKFVLFSTKHYQCLGT